MKIKQVLDKWGHADFSAIMICEHCGREVKITSGYDDWRYHRQVIPAMICSGCGKNQAGLTLPEAKDTAPEGIGVMTI